MEIKQGAFFRNKGYTTSNTGIFVLKQKKKMPCYYVLFECYLK